MGLTNTFRYAPLQPRLPARLPPRRRRVQRDASTTSITRGLATSTLDRETPRVIDGVLRDGKENTANPTKNTIVVDPGHPDDYYTNMSEELFIEKDINWVRLRDVTLRYQLPEQRSCMRETPACS